MSVLNTSLQTMVVDFRDMSGTVGQTKLHSRVFDAYEAKHLVFEAITADQVAVLEKNNNVIPPNHPVGLPYLIENWTELQQFHRQGNQYQLLPRLARNNAGYSVLQGICMCGGSPFDMKDRVDVNNYKVVMRNGTDMIDFRNTFNQKNADKLIGHVWFDGMMVGKKDTAFVSCHPTVTPAQIQGLSATVQFLIEWSNDSGDWSQLRDQRRLQQQALQNKHHLFLGSANNPGREIINMARQRGIHIFVKRGPRFIFTP